LAKNPLNQLLVPELSLPDFEVREILFKTRRGRYYRILYVIVEDEVRILRLRGPGEPDLPADELE
jgi:hypothetical protein